MQIKNIENKIEKVKNLSKLLFQMGTFLFPLLTILSIPISIFIEKITLILFFLLIILLIFVNILNLLEIYWDRKLKDELKLRMNKIHQTIIDNIEAFILAEKLYNHRIKIEFDYNRYYGTNSYYRINIKDTEDFIKSLIGDTFRLAIVLSNSIVNIELMFPKEKIINEIKYEYKKYFQDISFESTTIRIKEHIEDFDYDRLINLLLNSLEYAKEK